MTLSRFCPANLLRSSLLQDMSDNNSANNDGYLDTSSNPTGNLLKKDCKLIKKHEKIVICEQPTISYKSNLQSIYCSRKKLFF